MIKEIDGHLFTVIFKEHGNTLWCDGCNAEWSWRMFDESSDDFIELHRQWHKA
jgi:hypothetical protein